jgi:hypothetical protein
MIGVGQLDDERGGRQWARDDALPLRCGYERRIAWPGAASPPVTVGLTSRADAAETVVAWQGPAESESFIRGERGSIAADGPVSVGRRPSLAVRAAGQLQALW